MYRLEVYHPEKRGPAHVKMAAQATRVLEMIPMLLERHPDREHIAVWIGLTRLFAVDCQGNRIDHWSGTN